MKHGKTRLFALAAAHGASLLAVPPVLQAAETGQLEEIVVTARQREERIEDVPVSITAFTASEIRSAGIERPQDFIALTTGVSQVQTAEAGDMQVNIRGINTGRDSETNFALVIDGVLQTNPQALNQELSGVTQIEVLKGPQGALYGRNAVAGALILTTRKPGDEWDTDVTAGYGSDNSYKGSFYVGGPLTDGVKGSISAYTRKTDGQWKNLKNDCDDCVDRFEETGVSGRLLFEALGGTSTSRRSTPSSTRAPSISTRRSRLPTWRRSSARRSTRTRTSTTSVTSTTSTRRTSRRTSTCRSRATGTSASAR